MRKSTSTISGIVLASSLGLATVAFAGAPAGNQPPPKQTENGMTMGNNMMQGGNMSGMMSMMGMMKQMDKMMAHCNQMMHAMNKKMSAMESKMPDHGRPSTATDDPRG